MNVPFLHPMVLAAAVMAAAPGWTEGTSGRNCPQALAGYGTTDRRVLLEFAGSADLSFSVILEGRDGRFDGFVFPSEEEGGMAGVILDDCPDGDVTGAELEACTVWQGPVRTVDANGNAGNLPASNGTAAGYLQLEGLAAALDERAPDLTDGLPAKEIDRLTLLACLE
ncbi:hypothetical protein [Hoeflea poritis]|uniref:Uncharacterized protein n=1 Tax=Hoeflea poritis TaxID=2993659 RepID=A0ABT4VNA6_9HYPH|nr:hypothetical protein [Hoeflea poritis]MDA4845587.1 hypothetical protein [Hoeflea poritis]